MIKSTVKIKFENNPVVNEVISYGIFITGSGIVYNNGLDYLNVHFITSGSPVSPPDGIPLGSDKNDTIDNTLAFLNAFWAHPNIVYSRDQDFIYAVLITDEAPSISYSSTTNIKISTSIVSTGEDFTPLYLRYFFEYLNIVNDFYRCEIYIKDNFQPTVEIQGKAIIEKGGTKDHLDPIKGTGLTIELEANTSLTLEDLYTESEQDFVVRLYKNNKIIFSGFLKPDGVFQSFTRDSWILSLTCVDGLGSLDNLSFVKENGLRFFGKMKAIDIIYYCLRRTGVFLNINTSINIIYNGLTVTSDLDILNKIYLDSDRFFKADGQTTGDGTIMSCAEVLKSVLDLFCACITQQDGEWYIYKPNEIFFNSNVIFKRYSTTNAYLGVKTKKLSQSLGSQIDNFYPHHSGGNQKIQIKGGISAFRINYKYSFLNGLLPNSELMHDGNLNYADWNLDPVNKSYLINDPLTNFGFKINPEVDSSTNPNDPSDKKLLATSTPISLTLGDSFKWVTDMRYNGVALFTFKVRIGSYYLTTEFVWTTTPNFFSYLSFGAKGPDISTFIMDIQAPPVPVAGNAYIEIYVPKTAGSHSVDANFVEIHSVDFINTFTGDNVIGEFHTVSRKNKVSSLVKDNKTIFNGDNPSIVYLGAIYKEDSITTTDLWSRIGFVEAKPILRISAEEELRISQKPLKIFSGDFNGYYPFLSILNINNIDGKFMPTEHSYDTFTNVGSHKLLQLDSSEVTDIDYKLTYDYGETVKPTITS